MSESRLQLNSFTSKVKPSQYLDDANIEDRNLLNSKITHLDRLLDNKTPISPFSGKLLLHRWTYLHSLIKHFWQRANPQLSRTSLDAVCSLLIASQVHFIWRRMQSYLLCSQIAAFRSLLFSVNPQLNVWFIPPGLWDLIALNKWIRVQDKINPFYSQNVAMIYL